MRDALEDDAIIVADPGTPTPYLGAQYELRRAGTDDRDPARARRARLRDPWRGRRLATPAAGRRVVGMTGDGSFGMSVGELETITRLDLPVVIIQCSNGTFGWIKELQHLYHDDRYFSASISTRSTTPRSRVDSACGPGR